MGVQMLQRFTCDGCGKSETTDGILDSGIPKGWLKITITKRPQLGQIMRAEYEREYAVCSMACATSGIKPEDFNGAEKLLQGGRSLSRRVDRDRQG